MMPEADPPFVITGCSRSGTSYAARLLCECGVACGHERLFNIHAVQGTIDPLDLFSDRKRWRGDSSFLVVPFLERLPQQTVVFHQVREPVEVIRSHVGIKFFADEFEPSMFLAKNHPEFVRFVSRYCPGVLEHATEIERAMAYWLEWNLLAERAAEFDHLHYRRYRIEDLDRSQLRDMLQLIGAYSDPRRVRNAFATVPKTVNTRRRDESITWSTLPRGPLRNRLGALCHRYGYQFPTEDVGMP